MDILAGSVSFQHYHGSMDGDGHSWPTTRWYNFERVFIMSQVKSGRSFWKLTGLKKGWPLSTVHFHAWDNSCLVDLSRPISFFLDRPLSFWRPVCRFGMSTFGPFDRSLLRGFQNCINVRLNESVNLRNISGQYRVQPQRSMRQISKIFTLFLLSR